MGKVLTIGGACLNQTPMDWDNNLNNIRNAIREAKNEGVRLLCLPELCITGYGCEDMFLSPWIAEKALELLKILVPDTTDIAVAVGLPVFYQSRLYNTTCLIYDGDVLGFYAKQKLANDGVHYETRWFSPWEAGEVIQFEFDHHFYPFGQITVQLHGLKIGFEICEDAWREDRPACHPINKEVDLILNPSASHFAFEKSEFRETLVVRSSEKFNCVYLYTNLLGNESGRMIFDGDIIIAQKGELKARNTRLSFRDYNLVSCRIDFENTLNSETSVKKDWRGPLEEFGRACSLALFDYLRKSRNNGFVLSLSGGADSSCLAILVAEMVKNATEELGFELFRAKANVPLAGESNPEMVSQLLHTAYQGTVNSSVETFESARALAESIGARFYHWRIDEEINLYQKTIEKAIQRELNWQKDDVALQNIQARARAPVIWMLANIKGCLLLCTSNRSEGDVGYATMDGDTSGSIAPIAAVSKRFIMEWLKYAEVTLGYHKLSLVNNLIPTAELRPKNQNQSDEQDLMPYPVLEKIERLAIKEKKSPMQVYQSLQGHNNKEIKRWVVKFFKLWSVNQWKRERIAPSFHLDDFNIDPKTWCRFPILSGSFGKELAELEKS